MIAARHLLVPMRLLLPYVLLVLGCRAPASPIETAERIAAADPELRGRLQPRPGAWRSDGVGLVSPGFGRASLGARLPLDGQAAFEIGPGPTERQRVRLTPIGARSTPVEERAGRAVYRGLFPATDLIVVTGPAMIEQLLVLADASAPSAFSWRLDQPRGLSGARVDGEGGLAFTDERGRSGLRVQRPFAVDAGGTRRDATFAVNDGVLTLSLDPRGLRFPILLDPTWVEMRWLQVAGGPGPREGHNLAWDSVRNVTVMFGGQVQRSPSRSLRNDTWEWNGTLWTLRDQDSGPQRSYEFAMAYDPGRQRTVLFGGKTAPGGPYLRETWEWDGSLWRKVSTVGPAARSSATMVYEAARSRILLYGGESSGTFSDTWAWDGTTWTPVATVGPNARTGCAMVWDPDRSAVVLFGGSTGSMELAETWTFNGTAWSQLVTTGAIPTRSRHGMVYDTSRKRSIVFSGGTLGDTWGLTGTTWSSLSSSGPMARDSRMVYDITRDRVVMHGGTGPSITLDDTWEWGGASWSLKPLPAGSLPGRNGPVMVYETGRAKTLLFGGMDSTNAATNETWTWDGTTWARVATTGPSPRSHASAVYDSVRNRTVLFGGIVFSSNTYLNDTWEWNGTLWTRMATTGPSVRNTAGMAYDPVRQRTVLFGGSKCVDMAQTNCTSYSDTWEWDGASWQPRSPANPPAERDSPVMVYDVVRGKTVLFGGTIYPTSNVYGDLWTWDGTTWVNLGNNVAAARCLAAAAYDSRWDQLVIYGGIKQGGSPIDDTYVLSGTTFIGPTRNGPPLRSGGAMAYDSARRRSVLAGGYMGGAIYSDTWELHFGGEGCITGSQCDSGQCTDGVCCETSACGQCQACNLPAVPLKCSPLTNAEDPDNCTGTRACDATAVCRLKTGQSCSVPGDCVSGFCTGGVCCERACSGSCEACSATGLCAPSAAGSPGNPSCGAYACGGITSSCLTSCLKDEDCGAAYYCTPLATCAPRKGLAQACDARAGSDCLRPDCRVCSTAGGCVDGFCCGSACGGACQVCSMALGASANGVCTTAPAGYAGKPACAPYRCGGTSAACPSSCSADPDCVPGVKCVLSTCSGKLGPGELCSAGSDCTSGHCADSVCCDMACAGPCTACNLPAKAGTCSLAAVGSDPRGACTGAAGCATGCRADGSCGFTDAGAVCDVCKACDGNGRCNQKLASGDDPACGVVSCAALSTPCRLYDDLSTQRCVTVGQCASANDPDACHAFVNADDGTACPGGMCVQGLCVAAVDAGEPSVSPATGCAVARGRPAGGAFFAFLAFLWVSTLFRRSRGDGLR